MEQSLFLNRINSIYLVYTFPVDKRFLLLHCLPQRHKYALEGKREGNKENAWNRRMASTRANIKHIQYQVLTNTSSAHVAILYALVHSLAPVFLSPRLAAAAVYRQYVPSQ